MRIVKILFWVLVAAVVVLSLLSVVVKGATNIDPSNRYAWSDVSGWWDFYGANSVVVASTRLQGYASSSIGDISLDCATTRNGDICGASSYGVCNGPGPHNSDGTCPNGDASGDLTGWAWNDEIGWISFCGTTGGGSAECPSVPGNCQANLDSAGDFCGHLWNSFEGRISFKCNNK